MKRSAGTEERQRAEEEMTSLEVDLMILDYTAYTATEASLGAITSEKKEDEEGAERTLIIFHSFFAVFRKKRPAYKLDAQMRLRILLLKFLTLFMQRAKPNAALPTPSALLKLRHANKYRACAWIEIPGRIPSRIFNTTAFDSQLPIRGLRNISDVKTEAQDGADEELKTRNQANVSLLDILPLFMQISATSITVIGSILNQKWMELAAEFMLQAALDQYLAFAATGSDAVDEAFSWGYKPEANTTKGKGSEKIEVNLRDCDEMFKDHRRQAEIAGWASVRFSYLKRIFLDPRQSGKGPSDPLLLSDHLKDVAARHPLAQFYPTLLSFLQALGKAIDDPVLVQLERGELSGMDKQQTREFLEKCGVAGGGARFFDAPMGFKGA